MQMDAVLQLIGSGNVTVVETEWMSVVEREDVDVDELLGLATVLKALKERNHVELAQALAWAALENITPRVGEAKALPIGKAFLLIVNRSDEVRAQVTELYKSVYADRPSFELLLEASGIAGGRPPRRAIRTLDVCLAVTPGCYVVSRHDDSAARVDSIDPSTWEVTFTSPSGSDSLEPMAFADAYAPCDDTDIRVLIAFEPDRLHVMASKTPAVLVENVLRIRDEKLSDEQLEEFLTRHVLSPDEWSKWWPKARMAAKRSRHIRMEGRSPCFLEYVSESDSRDEEFEAAFGKLHTPSDRYATLDRHLRECKTLKRAADAVMLGRLREGAAERAQRSGRGGDTTSFLERLLEWKLAEAMNAPDGDQAAVAMLAAAASPGSMLLACDVPGLWRRACDCLEKAVPEAATDVMLDVFPSAPSFGCVDLARRLKKADLPSERIDQVVASVLGDPLRCCAALCWIWDKGFEHDQWRSASRVTVLTKIFWLAGEIQRDESIDRKLRRDLLGAIRSALSARKYERFLQCLNEVEAGMGAALRTQIQRLDTLGRVVHEDLLSRISSRFPKLHAKPETPVWALDDTILATAPGLSKWRAEIEELINVKMKENARAIGDAAEKGDLSENSEYKFALEERDLLRARVARLRDQVAQAHVLGPEEVPTDHVSVGAKVTFRHVESGTSVVLTFLGPFEANAEARVYNYQAPLGQDVMGLRVGDEIELGIVEPAGVYAVSEIRNWLDEAHQ